MQPPYRPPAVAGKVRRMIKRIALVLFLSATLPALTVVAQDKPATRPATTQADGDKSKSLAEKLSVTDHEITIGDRTLKYRATAGHMPLKDEAGKPRANFFFVA